MPPLVVEPEVGGLEMWQSRPFVGADVWLRTNINVPVAVDDLRGIQALRHKLHGTGALVEERAVLVPVDHDTMTLLARLGRPPGRLHGAQSVIANRRSTSRLVPLQFFVSSAAFIPTNQSAGPARTDADQ